MSENGAYQIIDNIQLMRARDMKQFISLDKLKRLILKQQSLQVTRRELECLYYLSIGKSAKQTAAALNISTRTVEFHLKNLRNKTGARNRLQLLSSLSLISF